MIALGGRLLRFGTAFAVCLPALLLPYGPRTVYGRVVAFAAHLPYLLFGRLARFLLRQVEDSRCDAAR